MFAYLAAQNGRPVPRDELAELLWGDELPATWEKALRVLMTKLRAVLEECGIDGSTALTNAFGCYKLTLPVGVWIDVEAAKEAAEHAEAALAEGDLGEARSQASAAAALARRSFLPGEDGSWVEDRRRDLRELLVRSLECLRDASFEVGEFAEAARYAEEVIELEPFRESGYRRLMQAHVAGGNPGEALRVYESCRRFFADELGAYPSPETESLYRELLSAPALVRPSPPEAVVEHEPRPARPRRRPIWSAVAAAVGVLAFAAGAIALIGIKATGGDARTPPEVLPNSLVRIDPRTLEPTDVVPIGDAPDLVVLAGGFAWVVHHALRDTPNAALRNAGDRTLTRVDLSTGEQRVVGGGVAPCGLAADPSGDVWVANCFDPDFGARANVVRIDATTLAFEATWPIPGRDDFYRGLAYGGGSLWLSEVAGRNCRTGLPCRLNPHKRHTITAIDPQTGRWHSIPLARPVSPLAWSEGYGDLWMSNFDVGSVSRLHAKTELVDETIDGVAINPGSIVVDGDSVWVADWSAPKVVRLRAVGRARLRNILLPVRSEAGVWLLAAGAGAVWATTPRDGTLWRIDPKTNGPTRITMPYLPTGVAADDNDVWVTVRAK